MHADFREKYGPWALVAGGAQGIGAAYSHYAAARGINVAVIDIHQGALDAIRADLETRYGIECLALRVDLGASDMLEQISTGVGEREHGALGASSRLL